METTTSGLCRLCAGDETGGSSLFGGSPDQELATLVNKYLPIQVQDDGKYPRTICPGCNIQLEATAQFIELVINGQSILRDLWKKTNLFKKAVDLSSLQDGDEIIIQVSENGCVYAPDHGISLRINGLNKPRKKRGRPRKTVDPVKSSTEETSLMQQIQDLNDTPIDICVNELLDDNKNDGKRKRNAPKRFTETLQGKELEKILREEGVTDDESDLDKNRVNFSNEMKSLESIEDDIIGHVENPDGEVLAISNSKGKVKRKARNATNRTCYICSLEFNSLKRYMAHLALHQTLSLQSNQEIDLQPPKEIIETSEAPTLETLTLTDHSIDINLDHSMGMNPENSYFVSGPSMPDITSDIMESVSVSVSDGNKDNMLVQSNNILLDSTSGNIFSEQDIHDPVSELITSSILPLATMPPEEMNKRIVEPEEPISQSVEIKTAAKSSKHKCPECGKVFISKQSCEIHLKVSHRGERPYKCQQCGKSFGYLVTLKHHLLSHYPKYSKNFACDICGKILKHPSSVAYHKESEHNNGHRFVCKKCGKAFKHRQILRRHQLVHSDQRPFVCKECNAGFKTKHNLLNHQQTHTGIKRFMCELCNEYFAHKNNLTKHARLHLGQKLFKCTVCDKAFSQNTNLSEHMRIHTGEKPYACTICQKKFTTSSQYSVHMERHNDQPWQCQECGKKLLSKESWRCHMKRHRNEKPFTCMCGKSFAERSSLRKHTRTHTGERPHVCNICNRSFADSSNLVKHKKIHRNEESKFLNDKSILEKASDSILNNEVLCVTYDDNVPQEFHIVDSGMNGLNTCELYESDADLLANTTSIPMNETITSIPETQNSSTIFDNFIDEDGNPIQFELQEGSQFAISSNVKFSQMKNDDFVIKDHVNELDQTQTDLLVQSAKESVQTIRFLTNIDENALTQYF